MNEKIVCFHLLNNYSGSPYVLSLVIKALKENGNQVILYTSRGSGFLSNISNVEYKILFYKWESNRLMLTILFILSQLQLFFSVIFKFAFRKNQLFYINTIAPFGAALGLWFLRKKIIYHVHEYYVRPNVVHKFALWVMKLTASKVIYVSNYLQNKMSVKQSTSILHNSLSPEFCIDSDLHLLSKNKKELPVKNVLMVSSLKKYKGILIFLDLANKMPEYEFCLVAGATSNEVSDFISMNVLPQNFTIYSAQSNVHPFYQKAGILINLSIPTLWVETFGLTILEGMAYGLPVIAPPVGGQVELVKDGINGYLIDPSDTKNLMSAIRTIFNDEKLYNDFSEASLMLSKEFSYIKMKKQLYDIISLK